MMKLQYMAGAQQTIADVAAFANIHALVVSLITVSRTQRADPTHLEDDTSARFPTDMSFDISIL